MSPLSIVPPGVRRQPKQRRSRTLVASIRQACLQILESEAPEQLTTKHIAEVAGVTIGSFYQYYPNKEAVLLDVLLEQAPGEADRIAAETRYVHTLSETSLPRTLQELVNLTCDRHLRMLALHGDIYRRYHREIDFQNLINASVRKYIEVTSWLDWVRDLLQRHRAAIAVSSFDIAAFIIATSIVNLTAEAVDTNPQLLDSKEFRSHLTQL
ncbi:MAG TPA: TetR/AcrR family transcriptional regulator, partial [Spongiibacteraceae bacterium]|nr:TetR/AcrR family transcriptional regulator [Spongiibacteraceae bacterium]